jgi:simple sugar transport system ATP-binding protein
VDDTAARVEMHDIRKNFGAIQALRGVDLTLRRGEVLGLVGDNAAGKSTLMKVLSGAHVPDGGRIFIDGRQVWFGNPEDSRALGIEMVYQDFALVDNLDVAANMFLGREYIRWGFGPVRLLDKRTMELESLRLIEDLRIDIDCVSLKVKHLSGGQRQAVAISRVTAFDARIIIMDEPTAALNVISVGKVLELIRQLKSQGCSIIIISHRLEDIHQVGDRVMVLRHGRKVCDRPIQGDIHAFRERVVAYMIGARDDYSVNLDE